jgi:hypothetical protein
MVTVHFVPETESQPLQPLKRDRSPVGVAVSITVEPLLKAAEQVEPQLIPDGLDVTVPPPRRRLDFFTVNITFTVNALPLVAVPPGVVTVNGPVVASAGTVARIVVAEVTVNVATLPANRTAVAPLKFVPLMVTLVPAGPLAGVKLVIVGALSVTTVKFVALVAVPAGVVTLSAPVVAPAGTLA